MSAPKRSVWTFPRPPALNEVTRRLRVVDQDGTVLADTTKGYEVLETRCAALSLASVWPLMSLRHPPTYYLPPEDCRMDLLKENSRSSFCEWKGRASYFDYTPANGSKVASRIWCYHKPSEKFKPIKDYLSFYASPWKCYVDDEEVQAQEGDFYGGWLTSDITGDDPSGKRSGIKGGPGTSFW